MLVKNADVNERVATWENIGNEFTGNLVSGIPEEMAFTVHKEPVGYVDASGVFHEIKNVSTVVNDKTGKAYGPVANNYCAIDNMEALGSLQYISGLNIKKYGETRGGMQYIIGQLPEVKILDDEFAPYLIYRNSFNGSYPIQACIAPLRIVCQNQINIAMTNAQNKFSIRHTAKATERLKEAQEILTGVNTYMAELTMMAEKYAKIKISNAERAKIIQELFPINSEMTDRQKFSIQSRIDFFKKALDADDIQNIKGTLWHLVESYADFITHCPGKNTKTAAENRFLAVTFDPRIFQKFTELVKSVVAGA